MRFFEELNEEHGVLLKALEVLEAGASLTAEDRTRLLDFFKVFLGEFHHGKEEGLLFPVLHERGLGSTGGPRCALYMQFRVERNQAAAILEAAPGSDLRGAGSPEIQAILDDNSMLGIPIEEHRAGHACLEALHHSVNDPVAWERVTAELVRLLRLHIEKEDECLFVMARSELPEDVLDELHRRAQELERAVGVSRIAAARETLIELEARLR